MSRHKLVPCRNGIVLRGQLGGNSRRACDGIPMRTPEWIQLVVVSLLVVAAQLRRLERDRQLNVALLALVAIAAISAVNFGEHWIPPYHVSIVWDWMPGALMLIPYWQLGQFLTIAAPTTEARLTAFDRAFFRHVGLNPADTRVSTITSAYLELTYLLVYPLVPLGVVTLYITRLRSAVDFYWAVVLSATYLCYGATLAIRARPPRMLLGHERFQLPKTPVRELNREILDHASIQAITCPSAHVASALAAALVLLYLQPWIGLLFLWAALSIAVATIVGGYHYVADVLSAALVAILVFAIACFI
jgi:membrane-associated phospholipid phosphatase